MVMSLKKDELKSYIHKQIENFFPDQYSLEGKDVDAAFDLGLERLENCFKYVTFQSYCDQKGQTFFSHMHADQYAQFLYYFSNSLWELSENKAVCDKLINLNRTLHGFFFSYKGKLPDIFLFGHPVGSIIGNAVYHDFLVIFQNVTINTANDQEGNPAPILGKGLFLGAGSKIIGNQPIGDRVSIGVDALVYNQSIGNDKVVIRSSDGHVLIKERRKEQCMAQRYFNVPIV